jgi:hypothetical protein
MESNLNVEVLLTIPQVAVYHIDAPDQRLLHAGTLKFCHVSNSSVYVIIVGDFTYTLSHELPVMRSSSRIVFPDVEGYYGIVLPFDTDADTMMCLDELMRCQCDYRIPDAGEAQEQEVEQVEWEKETSEIDKPIEYVEEEKKATETNEPHAKAKKIGNWLSEAGKKAKNTMMKGAFLGALGIVQGGIYIKGKIKKREKPITISEKNQEKLEKIKKASNKVLSVSQVVIDKALKATAKAAKKISNKITNNGNGNKLTRSKTYQSAAEIGRGALSAVGEVFDGLEQALGMLGRATSNVTVDIVTHRYGESAGIVTSNSIDAAVNVGKIALDVRSLGVKKLTKSTIKHTAEILVEENKEGEIEYRMANEEEVVEFQELGEAPVPKAPGPKQDK